MRDVDSITKVYMSRNDVFADAFNYWVYQGRQVITPDSLKNWDTTEIAIPYGKDGKGKSEQRQRDVLKYASIKEDEHAIYMLLGIENQTRVHYAMPVRNMFYDVLQYVRQIEAIAVDHKRKKDTKGHSSDEYLSGFYKDDLLTPVITLVVFFSPETWDGPRSLKEMMRIDNPEIDKLVQDYRIHIIEPAALTAESSGKFKTDLGAVLDLIRYEKDKAKMLNLVRNDERFRSIDKDAAMVIEACTDMKVNLGAEKEEVNMCQAWQEILEDTKNDGITQGISQGISQGDAFTASLFQKLFNTGRMEDAVRASGDAAYRASLLQEMGLVPVQQQKE